MFHFTYVSEPPKCLFKPSNLEAITKLAEDVPFEIQSEIVKMLPVKSVVQCRSVSKPLKSHIDSPRFIASYHTHTRNQKHHFFVKYKLARTHELQYVSIADDDNTFPNQKSPLPVPFEVMCTLEYSDTIHSVNGLLCYHSKNQAILWNPTIQKSLSINVPNSLSPSAGITFVGFGARPDNASDVMLVRINLMVNNWEVEVFMVNNWEVEVFILSTRAWKTVSNIPPAFKTCCLMLDHVCVNGFIYWVAYDTIKEAAGISSKFIISFDLKSNEFGQVCLPNRLVHTKRLEVSKVSESLGLFEYYNQGEAKFCDVWIMKEEGVRKSFTKMLSIKALDSWVRYRVLELRKNGEAFVHSNDGTKSVLQVYDTCSGSISCMLIDGASSFFVNSYMETLLLLDESDSSIH